MAYHGRQFFNGRETYEEKTRKYTQPYPIVTSQLINLRHNLLTTSPGWRPPLNIGLSTGFLPSQFPIFGMHSPIMGSPIMGSPMQHQHQQQQHQHQQNRKRRHGNVNNANTHTESKRRRSDGENASNQEHQGKYSKLSNEMLSYSSSHQQSVDLLQKKLKLRSALLNLFRRQFPTASLHLVGSSCNGFATDTSDADFCVMLTHHRRVDQKYEAQFYLKSFQKLLRTMSAIKRVLLIRAKVPILKFRDSISGCECDVNVNNATGIRNTHLLRTYSKIDNRVCPLVMCIKRWAKARDINDASQGTLSSYSLVLMVIHYLQSGCDPPLFDSLQLSYPDFFQSNSNVDQLPMFEPANLIPRDSSPNIQPLGELLQGFFEYYGVKYSWDRLVISVRLGRASPRSEHGGELGSKFICIEEPFELTNTARAVYNYDRFTQIKHEFTRAHNILKENLSLDAIL